MRTLSGISTVYKKHNEKVMKNVIKLNDEKNGMLKWENVMESNGFKNLINQEYLPVTTCTCKNRWQ